MRTPKMKSHKRGMIQLKRIKIILILACVSLTAFAAALICACSIGEPSANTEGLDAYVTYYSNGGELQQGNPMMYQTLRFADGAPILDIGTDTVKDITFALSKSNYEFGGWAYAELDEGGKPILTDAQGQKLTVRDSGSPDMLDSNGREINEQEKVFSAQVKMENGSPVLAFKDGAHPKADKDNHIYLAAYWVPSVKINYVVAADDAITFAPADGGDKLTFQPDDVFANDNFGSFNEFTLKPDEMPLDGYSPEGYSFINLYLDKNCTNPVPDGYKVAKPQPDETGKAESVTIYARFKEGEWTPLRDADDVRSMLGKSNNSDSYILVYDIDMQGASAIRRNERVRSSFTLEGENHTIKGLNFASTPGAGLSISMFGDIAATTKIKDVTFEDITFTLSASRGSCSFYLLFSTFAEGATIENVKVDGVEATVTLTGSGAIGNMQLGYKSNWLYGGSSTDAEFEAAHGDIVVNENVTINN